MVAEETEKRDRALEQSEAPENQGGDARVPKAVSDFALQLQTEAARSAIRAFGDTTAGMEDLRRVAERIANLGKSQKPLRGSKDTNEE